MASSGAKTNRPNQAAIRKLILEKSESLMARDGVERVSVRQIAAEAGYSNNGLVAYYFGTKDALIQEIFRHRLGAIDKHRRELLDEADARGASMDLGTLVRVLCLPLIAQTNDEGQHSYAGFLAGLSSTRPIHLWQGIQSEIPATNEVLARLRQLLPGDSHERFHVRLEIALGLIANTLNMIDSNAAGIDAELAEKVINCTLSSITQIFK